MVYAGSQDLSHVMGSSGLIAGATGGQEITLTINNSSLTQALASSCSGSVAGNPQEITLTISGITEKACIVGSMYTPNLPDETFKNRVNKNIPQGSLRIY